MSQQVQRTRKEERRTTLKLWNTSPVKSMMEKHWDVKLNTKHTRMCRKTTNKTKPKYFWKYNVSIHLLIWKNYQTCITDLSFKKIISIFRPTQETKQGREALWLKPWTEKHDSYGIFCKPKTNCWSLDHQWNQNPSFWIWCWQQILFWSLRRKGKFHKTILVIYINIIPIMVLPTYINVIYV